MAANEVWYSLLLEIQTEMEAGSEVTKPFERVCQCEESEAPRYNSGNRAEISKR